MAPRPPAPALRPPARQVAAQRRGGRDILGRLGPAAAAGGSAAKPPLRPAPPPLLTLSGVSGALPPRRVAPQPVPLGFGRGSPEKAAQGEQRRFSPRGSPLGSPVPKKSCLFPPPPGCRRGPTWSGWGVEASELRPECVCVCVSILGHWKTPFQTCPQGVDTRS